jgi:hypothetical protein
MGLVVRLYDIVSPNKFNLSIGTSPYGYFKKIEGPEVNGAWPSSNVRDYMSNPICMTNDDPTVPPPGSGTTCENVVSELEFDTEYWIKLEDNVNDIDVHENDLRGRYVIHNIYIHDSKAFDCYDRIEFGVDLEVICPTPTPNPTSTPPPTPQPTQNATPLPSATPLTTSTPTPTPTILVNTETEINIFFDSSGSMYSSLTPLTTMRDTLLQNCLLPFYNNDVNLYNSRVTITNKGDERAINWIATQPSDPTYNVVNLAFADESNVYEAEAPLINGWTNGSAAGNSDIALLRTNLNNATTSTSHRGVIFQVDTLSGGNEAYPQYQSFMNALFNGIGYYTGTAGLSDKNEVSCTQDTIAGSTPQYYVDLIVSAMNNLGYTIPSC